MLALTPAVLQLISLGIQIAPGLISAAQQEVALVTATAPPDAATQAAIDAALDEAHAALQAAQPARPAG